MVPPALAPLVFGAMNVASATGIVFANKTVFSVFNFKFTYALTLIHTIVTLFGMKLFMAWGLFQEKKVQSSRLLPLAIAYVAYIVLCNLNLNMNPVGFYQISKIAVAPAILFINAIFYGKTANRNIILSIVVVCVGVGLATISDPEISSNLIGLLVGLGSILATALYQIWAGEIQKELGLGSMQLLNAYIPLASSLLGTTVILFEPLGILTKAPGTIIGYTYTAGSILAILLSAVLGLMVNLSTFLVIGATSSLTYNVVGHIKTIIILAGGVAFFGDSMSVKKMLGIIVAMLGIIWYSHIKLNEAKIKPHKSPLPVKQTAVAENESIRGSGKD